MRQLWIIFAVLAATPAWAEQDLETHGDRLVPRSEAVFDSSSAAERRHQHVELLLGTYGYGLGIFTSDNTILELGYTGLEEDEERQEWSHGGFAHAKFFRGNSFYWTLGVSGRESGPLATPAQNAQTERLFGDLALGNQWQWRHFTLGCDWIGISAPFYTQVQANTAAVSHSEAFAAPRAIGGPEWHVLRLYAGLTF